MQFEEMNSLLNMPLEELVAKANKVRREFAGSKIELCNILNAKSGHCAEDCKFCAQSARHKTGINNYSLKSKGEMIEAAKQAKEIGAERFDIVTSGDKLSKAELAIVTEAIKEITGNLKMKMCASLGSMDEAGFALLKSAGLSRYHHNIETSPHFFKTIITTHTFEDRIRTIKAAKKAGLEVCSGGIIGLGETFEDRIQMALTLRELDVDSVPLNILVPIKGTALENQESLSPKDAIRTVAIFRIILKDKIIKIAAGRESILRDFQGLAFLAGANGMLIGGYLTIRGRSVEEDHKLVEEIEKLWNA